MNNKKIISGLMFVLTGGLSFAAFEPDVRAQENEALLDYFDLNTTNDEVELFEAETTILFENFLLNKEQFLIAYKEKLNNQITDEKILKLGNEVVSVLEKFKDNVSKNPSPDIALNWLSGITLEGIKSGMDGAFIAKELSVANRADYIQLSGDRSTYESQLAYKVLEIINAQMNFLVSIEKINKSSSGTALNYITDMKISTKNDAYVMFESLRMLSNKAAFEEEVKQYEKLKSEDIFTNLLQFDSVLRGINELSVVENNKRFAKFYNDYKLGTSSEDDVNKELLFFIGNKTNSKIINNILIGIKQDRGEIESSKDLFQTLVTNFKESFTPHPSNDEVLVLKLDSDVKVQIEKELFDSLDEYTELKVDVIEKNKYSVSLKSKLKNEIIETNGKMTISFPVDTYKSVVVRVDESKESAVPHLYESGYMHVKSKDLNGEFLIKETQIPTFQDVEGNFAKNSIFFLEQRKIVTGTTKNKFSPQAQINRASFAVMLARALELKPILSTTFEDTKGKWFETGVQALSDAGFIAGTTKATFSPNDNLTRQDAAVIISRIFKAHNVSPVEMKEISTFSDYDKMSPYAQNAIRFVYSLNIMGGKGGNKFDPKGDLTRAEMAKILHYSLKKLQLY